MATGATPSLPGKRETEDSGGRGFAPGETSDALRKRSGHPVKRRLEDTSRVQTKTENEALRSGFAWVLKGWNERKASGLSDPAGVVLLGCLQFLRVCLASLLRFPAKARFPNNTQPAFYLQISSSADTLFLRFHARLGLNVSSSFVRRLSIHLLELKQQTTSSTHLRVQCRCCWSAERPTNGQK